jgi:hypothetical protein
MTAMTKAVVIYSGNNTTGKITAENLIKNTSYISEAENIEFSKEFKTWSGLSNLSKYFILVDSLSASGSFKPLFDDTNLVAPIDIFGSIPFDFLSATSNNRSHYVEVKVLINRTIQEVILYRLLEERCCGITKPWPSGSSKNALNIVSHNKIKTTIQVVKQAHAVYHEMINAISIFGVLNPDTIDKLTQTYSSLLLNRDPVIADKIQKVYGNKNEQSKNRNFI